MHRRGFTQVLFASLFALGLVTAATGCPRAKGPKAGTTSLNGERNLTNGVWLFGYDATQARQLAYRAKSDGGLIPVKLAMDADGEAQITLISDCHVAGKYQYQTGNGNIEDHITITSEDQAKAMLPYSFLSFSGEYKSSSNFEIHYRSPGDYVAPGGAFQLTGAGCSQATHVVTHLTIGAFTTKSGAQISAGGSGGVNGGPQAGGSTQSSNQQATSGGDLGSCGGAAPATQPGMFGIPGFAPPVLPTGGAPDQCSLPLKLTLAPINGTPPAPGDKNATGSSLACQDTGLMSATQLGFHFDGSVFTLQADQLKSVDPSVKNDFACVGAIAPAEAFAMDKIIMFLKARPAVRAHVSISCTPLFMGPNASNLHMNLLQAKFAAAGLAGRVAFDECFTGMFNPIPVGNGVHVELVAGCSDIPAPPKPKCSK